MQGQRRLGSRARRQARRLTAGLATAVAVHLAAWFALASLPDGGLVRRGGLSDVRAVAIELVIVRPVHSVATAAKPAPADAASAMAHSAEAEDAPEAMPAQPDADGPAASGAPSGGGLGPPGDDGLFRVPFRDATGQAAAELRAGLGCAHVDTSQLPKALRDQCAMR